MTAETIDPRWNQPPADTEFEPAFRAHRLNADRTLLQITCGVVVLAVAGYILNDIRNPNAEHSPERMIVALRIAIIALTITYGLVLARVRDARTMDAMTMLIVLAVTGTSLWVDASRPKDFFTHVGADVVILMAIYLVIPISQILRFVSTAGFTVGLLLLYFLYKEIPNALTGTSVIVSVGITNLMGILISVRHARTERMEFIALRREQAARQALEKAQTKIRSLSGLIPICAGCKKVRNDKGFWEQVESYVRDRSEAEFSHSLCPSCVERYRV